MKYQRPAKRLQKIHGGVKPIFRPDRGLDQGALIQRLQEPLRGKPDAHPQPVAANNPDTVVPAWNHPRIAHRQPHVF